MPAPVSAAARLPWNGTVASEPLPPAPSLLDSIPAAYRGTKDTILWEQEGRLDEAYRPIVEALQEQSGQRGMTAGNPFYRRIGAGKASALQIDRDRVWLEITKARQANSNAFPEVAGTREAFETGVLTRYGARAADQQTAARGGIVPQFIGGLAATATDPVNLGVGVMTSGLSAETTLLRGMLIDGTVNAASELVQTPANIEARRRVGEATAVGDVAMSVGEAFVFGAGLHAGMQGLHAGFEKAVAAGWDRLPEGLRTRWAERTTLDPAGQDKLLADISTALIGPERMTDAEAGAAAHLTRQAEIDGANPFTPNGAGVQAHADLLAQRMAAIMADVPAGTRAFVPGERVGGMGDTALGTGTVAGDAQSRFMGKVRVAESSGNDAAQAATSSAFGRYQFTKGTWYGYYVRRFGTGGLTREQIYAKRADPNLQDVLMADLTADNAARLRRMGAPETEGNLYLMHLLGPADAERVLHASPETPLEGLINKASIAANRRIMEGKTAADIRAFAARRMGSAGDDGAGLHLDPASDMPVDMRGQIDAELAAVRAQAQKLEDDLRAQGVDTQKLVEEAEAADLRDAAAPTEAPGPDGLPQPLAEPVEPALPEPRPDAAPPETQTLAGRLRDVVADPKRDLNNLDALAADLGASPQEVRAALLELVKDNGGGLRIRKKDGAFVRKPVMAERGGGGGPMDVLDFIASKGGIRDDEGHNLGLKGLSPREKREIISPEARRRLAEQRRAGAGSRNWQRMTRRNGPLLRHEGRSIDQIGELLHEAGYLDGADGGRPTKAEVIDYIEQRIQDGKARFTREDVAAGAGQDMPAERGGKSADNPYHYDPALADTFDDMRIAAEGLGMDASLIDEDMVLYAADLRQLYPDMEPGDVFSRVINDIADANRWDAVDESGEAGYEDIDYAWPHTSENPEPGSQAGAAAPDRGGPQSIGSDPRAGGQDGGGDGANGQGDPPDLADMPPEEATRFLDPTGEAAKTQIDTLEHDARMGAQETQFKSFAPGATEAEKSVQTAIWMVEEHPPSEHMLAAMAKLDDDPAMAVAYLSRVAEGTARDGDIIYMGTPRWAYDKGFIRFASDGVHRWGEITEAGRAFVERDGKPAPTLDNGAAVDPNIRVKTRQETDLAAQQRLDGSRKTGKAQDPVMPEGLFGGPVEPTFNLGDGGPPKTMTDILKALDEDEAANATIRNCMVPKPGEGA